MELDDGRFIAECTAITQYLDALDPPYSLTGTTPADKGIIHMMTKRAEIEFLDAVSTYFHHATPGLGSEIELYQNPEWGNRMRDKGVRGMHYFDQVLKSQSYVAGNAFSMADIAVIGGMIFSALVKLDIPSEYAALHEWYNRVQTRSSVQQWKAMVDNERLQRKI